MSFWRALVRVTVAPHCVCGPPPRSCPGGPPHRRWRRTHCALPVTAPNWPVSWPDPGKTLHALGGRLGGPCGPAARPAPGGRPRSRTPVATGSSRTENCPSPSRPTADHRRHRPRRGEVNRSGSGEGSSPGTSEADAGLRRAGRRAAVARGGGRQRRIAGERRFCAPMGRFQDAGHQAGRPFMAGESLESLTSRARTGPGRSVRGVGRAAGQGAA